MIIHKALYSGLILAALKADGLSLSVVYGLVNRILVCVTPTNRPQSVHTVLMQTAQQPPTGPLQSDWKRG